MATITIIKVIAFFTPVIVAGVFFIMYKVQKQKAMALELANSGLKARLKAFETRQKYLIKNRKLTAEQLDLDLQDYFRND